MTTTITTTAASAATASPPGAAPAELRQRFLRCAAELTAFTEYDLEGTGQADSYLACVIQVVGEQTVRELLDACERAVRRGGDDRKARARALAEDLFSSEKLGPVARNVIKLWYVGIWYELPPDWSDSFGPLPGDGTFTVSPDAYPEGLLWRAIGANPPGARAPGFGSWASPPVIPPIPGEDQGQPQLVELLPAQAQPEQAGPVPTPVPALAEMPQQRESDEDLTKESTS